MYIEPWANNVDSEQTAHWRSLFRVFSVRSFVKLVFVMFFIRLCNRVQ